MTQRTGRPRGRPPTDPAKLAAALQDVAQGLDVVAAARAHGVSKTALYGARKAADVAAQGPGRILGSRGPEGREQTTAGESPSVRSPAPRREGDPALAAPPREPPTRPAGGTAAEDLELVDAEIEATKTQLRERRTKGDTHGMAALQKNLLDLIRRRRELRPPPPPDPDDEERRWRGAADRVISKIRAGVQDAKRRRDGSPEGKAA